MRRVLIFSTEFPPGPGGIGVQTYHLARNLSKTQWEVLVLAKQEYASHEEILAFNQLQPFLVNQWPGASKIANQSFERWQTLCGTLRSFRPQILIASGESAVWLAAMATQIPTFRKINWVAIWHGVTPTHPFLRQLSLWAYCQPQAVIAVSQYGLLQLQHMGVQPQASRVIHNGADPELFFPISEDEITAFRARFAPGGSLILLTVGHVSQRKGQDIVIQALPKIIEAFPNTHYWMVGLPTLRKELEKIAKELGVLEHVHFLGKLSQEELRAAYNACDLFVMTSRHSQDGQFEGYGIAVVEAALCGKASVVSDNSGLAEAILPNETGLVVPENNPEGTTQAVIELLGNPGLCSQMGEKARQRALAEQTWTMRISEYDRFLNELVQEVTSPGERTK